MQKKLVIVCLLNFLVAAIMGLILRYFFVFPFSLDFRHLLHAHSHGAMLGWVYLMIYLLLVHYFVPIKKPAFTRLFWLTELSVIGMFISFPIQGYAFFSISFSTLHIICSYLFIRLIWKNYKVDAKPIRVLLKASLVFMFVSTMGIWGVGPAVARYGLNSEAFQVAIQFFLHFQFNGWFMFAVLAIFLRQFHLQDSQYFSGFFKTLVAATILTFALPVSWSFYHSSLLWINGLGVTLQLISAYYFIKMLQPHWKSFWMKTPKVSRWMFGLALISFILKVALQSLSIIPEVSAMAYNYHNFVIGFIHLMMLGVISGFLFSFLLTSNLMNINAKLLKFGVYNFILGFIATEFLLLLQGVYFYFSWGMLPQYYLLLFLCSILLPLGIIVFIFNIYNHDTKTIKTT